MKNATIRGFSCMHQNIFFLMDLEQVEVNDVWCFLRHPLLLVDLLDNRTFFMVHIEQILGFQDHFWPVCLMGLTLLKDLLEIFWQMSCNRKKKKIKIIFITFTFFKTRFYTVQCLISTKRYKVIQRSSEVKYIWN